LTVRIAGFFLHAPSTEGHDPWLHLHNLNKTAQTTMHFKL